MTQQKYFQKKKKTGTPPAVAGSNLLGVMQCNGLRGIGYSVLRHETLQEFLGAHQ
uniref:Uncharacterized protein n=1 Tax=Anguilla anguilla TaxID=7936 RepID=A0A0E9T7L0_ANGAN